MIDREASKQLNNAATVIDQHIEAHIAALTVLAVSPLAEDPARWKDLYQEARAFYGGFGTHVILADSALQMLPA